MSLRLRLLGIGILGTVLTGLLSLLWLAAADRAPPWRPVDSLELQAADFGSPTGTVTHADGRLRTRAVDALGQTLLVHGGLRFDATAFRHLQLDFDPLPPTLRPLLLWAGPAGQGSSAIPWRAGGGTIDLGKLPGWTGEINTLGIALLPQDIVPVAASNDRLVGFGGVRLMSDSRRGAVAAVWSEWLAWRPWSGRSINTGGFELPVEASIRPRLWLALSVAGGALAVLLTAAGRQRRRPVLVAAALTAWLMMDLLQLRQLEWRSRTALAARSGVAADTPMTAQPTWSAPLAALKPQLDALPGSTRVLVYGESSFMRQYPVFLLREYDVAPLPSLAALPEDAVERRAVLALFGAGDWSFDPQAGTLRLGGRTLPADRVFDSPGQFGVYRLGRGDSR